jgi:TonB family protein
MSQQLRFKKRKTRSNPMHTRRVGAAFEPAPAGGGAAIAEFPGVAVREPGGRRRTFVAGGTAAALHAGALGLLILLAALNPDVREQILEVRLLNEVREEPKPDEPAPAPMALAERRLANFAPQVQSFQPQIVNPRVIADAAPAIHAEALQMDAVASVVAPTQISRSSVPVVETVSVVNSPIAARASKIDVQGVGGPAVRGPVKIAAPIGASVGPRAITVTEGAPTMGTGTMQIGGDGSSVREGKITGRDVVGTPTGAPLVSINTEIGDGLLHGSGGSGSSLSPAATTARECFSRPEVKSYLGSVQNKTLDRWILPPGVTADQTVTLRFKIDAAGSATSVSLVEASDNALGASAVDALRAAAPFPPMPDPARCLSRVPITATFSNPLAG